MAGCRMDHSFADGGRSGIGPDLWNAAGKPIASAHVIGYPDALKGLDESWTKQAPTAFLLDPAGYAPGTTMPATNVTKLEATQVVEFLLSLN